MQKLDGGPFLPFGVGVEEALVSREFPARFIKLGLVIIGTGSHFFVNAKKRSD